MSLNYFHCQRQPPKDVFYHTNGTGRDSYIIDNNGGTCAKRSYSVHPVSGRYFNTSHVKPRIIKPSSDRKTIHYTSDGSGRDNYIIYNQGGLMFE